MSQRLLVALEKNVTDHDRDCYDGVYTEESTLKELLYDWCEFDSYMPNYVVPWEIFFRDNEFMDQFMDDFKKLGKYILNLKSLKDCWTIYEGEKLVWEKFPSQQIDDCTKFGTSPLSHEYWDVSGFYQGKELIRNPLDAEYEIEFRKIIDYFDKFLLEGEGEEE